MDQSKPSEPGNLSGLDGNDLVARLAVVKDRMLDLMDQPSEVMLVARADSEAVLDECASRLLGSDAEAWFEGKGSPERVGPADVPRLAMALRDARDAYAEAVELAAATKIQRDEFAANVWRLRELIRDVVEQVEAGRTYAKRLCPGCGTAKEHNGGCVWPDLVAEAENP
jgi:hypothetical protein